MTTNYHKCAKPDCNAMTLKDVCRHHAVILNHCTYLNCNRKCRKQFCNRHDPAYMARENARRANKRLLKKNQTMLAQVTAN